MHEEHITDMPGPIRWFLVAFKQVGFPVLVCIYLAYMQFVDGRNNIKAINEFKEVMLSLKDSIDQQTKALRRHRPED